MNDNKRLLELLKDKSLEVRPVTLSSGKISDYYMDCKRVTLSPEGAYLTGKLMLEMIRLRYLLWLVRPWPRQILSYDPSVQVITERRTEPGLSCEKSRRSMHDLSYAEGWLAGKGRDGRGGGRCGPTSGSIMIKKPSIDPAEGDRPAQALTILDLREGGRREAIEERGLLQALLLRRFGYKVNK